jgi:hypothetical protein
MQIDPFYIIFKIWLALAIVKTLMGYWQLPTMLKLMSHHLKKDLGKAEVCQIVLFAPIINFFATPYYLIKEKLYFFAPYEKEYMEAKFKDMKML